MAKMTPQELFEYALEHGKIIDLIMATLVNDKDFKHIPLQEPLQKDEKGSYFTTLTLDGLTEKIPIADKGDANYEVLEKIEKDPANGSLHLVLFKKEAMALATYNADENARNREESTRVMLLFLEKARIDTIDKLNETLAYMAVHKKEFA